MSDLLHSIQVASPCEAVFPLVSTAAGLSNWWASDVTESHGAVELGFFNRETVYRLLPQANEPPKHAEWACETGHEWAGTRLVFHLAPAGAGTLVHFTHAGWKSPTDYFVSCNTVWGELLFRLKAAAEGRSRGPLFLAGGLAN
jgi:hypothetical protein